MRTPRTIALAVAATLAAPSAASAAVAAAADPPTILTAGIDAADHLYATWSLGAGTTYERAAFATSPQPHPFLAGFFADADLADVGCSGIAGCTGTPASTSYTSSAPMARDRRYFVEVTATTAKAGQLTSAVWVIDEAKPLIAGEPPDADPRKPAGMPALGRLFAPAPASSLTVLKLPATIAGVLRSDVRMRVRCSAPCDVDLRLSLDARTLVRRTGRLAPETSTKLALQPTGPLAEDLRRRGRARLTIRGSVTPFGGITKRVLRSFVVHR